MKLILLAILLPAPLLNSAAADSPSFLKVPSITDDQITAVIASGSGISGPGQVVVGNGWGGFADGRKANGLSRHDVVTNSGIAVTEHLIPPIHPILDVHMRDTSICPGGDGCYYMTGTTGDNAWMYNDGIELYRSTNLKDWEYLGLVWSIDKDGSEWEKTWRDRGGKAGGQPIRSIWAPEIHYIHKNYYICISMPNAGTAILKSSTGKPEGPYLHAAGADKPLINGIDPTLFEDDDGAVYFTRGRADTIVRMKDDLSDFAETPRPVTLLHPDHDPSHHHPMCKARSDYNDLGFEGATLFKANGLYYLGATDKVNGNYTMCLATAKSVYGPYDGRHATVTGNGGTGFFKDFSGRWYTAYFGDDSNAPWRSKPGIIRVDFDKDKNVVLAKDQPDFILLKERVSKSN